MQAKELLESIIFAAIILFGCSCKSKFRHFEQSNDSSTYVKKSGITSVIFSEKAECFLCNFGPKRFSPNVKEINTAEEILYAKIKSVNNPMYDQGDGCPIIHKNLNNYRRQYYGFLDNEGNKIIYVNLSWARYSILDRIKGHHKDISENWKKERVIVLDGCSYHWEIEINLTKKQLQNLSINGSA
ncbi:hypothetical protein [Sphingobacterium hungaricum]